MIFIPKQSAEGFGTEMERRGGAPRAIGEILADWLASPPGQTLLPEALQRRVAGMEVAGPVERADAGM